MPTKGGPQDPRIQQIREAIARNPKFTRSQCYKSFGVARTTLDRWIAEGLLPQMYVPIGKELSSYWRRWLPPTKKAKT